MDEMTIWTVRAFFTFVLIVTLNSALAAECEDPLLPPIELSSTNNIKTTNLQGALSHRLVNLPVEFPLQENEITVSIPVLSGLRLTRRPILRDGQRLGYVGRTQSNRVVILEPIENLTTPGAAIARTYFILNRLAEMNLAVPVFGIARIKNAGYLVRPAWSGTAPLAFMSAADEKTTLIDIETLEAIRKPLEEFYPGFVNWGILPAISWRDRKSDSDFYHEKLPSHFRLALDEFLGQIRFAKINGHLMLETLPALVTNFSLSSFYPIVREMEGRSWRFERWNWYRYLLAAQLAENEKPGFYQWIQKESRIEWMMRFQFLARLIRQSPEFPAPRARMTGKPFAMVLDAEAPFVRPPAIAFSDRKSEKYHFKKHGVGMGFTSSAEYLVAAQNFILTEPSANRLYFLRATGDIVLTDTSADQLAVFTPQGVLRTYFRPSVAFHGHGHNPYYIYEQLLKDDGFLN